MHRSGLLCSSRAKSFPATPEVHRGDTHALAGDLHQPHQRSDGLAPAELEAKGGAEAGDPVLFLEPVLEQPPGDLGGPFVGAPTPDVHGGANLRHQQQLARPAAGLVLPPPGRRCVVLDQLGRGWLPGLAPRDLGQVPAMRGDRLAHGLLIGRSCRVSFWSTIRRCPMGISSQVSSVSFSEQIRTARSPRSPLL